MRLFVEIVIFFPLQETDGYHETGNGGAGVDVREGDPEVAVVTETSRRAREVLIGQGAGRVAAL